MGFGISSFVSRGTRKALIRWIDPENNNESEVFDNSQDDSILNPKSIAQNAKQFLSLALVDFCHIGQSGHLREHTLQVLNIHFGKV